jgi:transcriptional regulator with XRE-family HTH domain
MTESERKEVAKRFAKIREDQHLNQRQMAERLRVSASLISEIERGARDPSKKILIDFKNEFNRDVEWLLTGIDSSDLALKEKNQKINELETTIRVREQEINDLTKEKVLLQAQIIATQAELVKAQAELLKR